MTEEFVPRGECNIHVISLTKRLDDVELLMDRRFAHIEDTLSAIWKKIDGRPSWAVLIIITFLTSTCVALLVLLITILMQP